MSRLCGGALILLGAAAIARGLANAPWLVTIFLAAQPLHFLTALSFVLTGTALFLTATPPFTDAARRFVPLLGLAVVLAGLAGLLGIFPVPVASSLALAGLGLGLVLFSRAKTSWLWLAVEGLAFVVTLTGLFVVTLAVMSLKGLSVWHQGMAFHDGLGFMLAGLGLLSAARQHAREEEANDTRRVNQAGANIIMITGLFGVFGGFWVLHGKLVQELEHNLQLSLTNRVDAYTSALEDSWEQTYAFANQPLRLKAMRVLETRHSAQDALLMHSVAGSAHSFGFSAAVFRTPSGKEIARYGSFKIEPELVAPLGTTTGSSLLWEDGLYFHTSVVMHDEDGVAGTLEVERPLPRLDKILRDSVHIGETTDFAVCAQQGKTMSCFPLRSLGWKLLHNRSLEIDGKPVPMSHALKGEKGVIHTEDYRGHEVIAAYQPLGATGLGTVLKIDAAEFYQPIASRLSQLLAVLFLLTAAGILLLRLQLLPLVRKMANEISQRKAAEDQLSFLAHHDPLTQLPNRLLLTDRFAQAAASARRNDMRLALLFCDLDNFKQVNDNLGHPVGDLLLIEMAKRLKKSIRDTDTLSRQGGDEFVILLTELNETAAVGSITQKILDTLTEPFEVGGHVLEVSMSIGIAICPEDGMQFDTLLKKADAAVYEAKDNGRNTYRFFNETMTEDAMEQLKLQNQLRSALALGEFVLYYQPQLDLHTSRVIGAEALIRWQHPARGLIPPNKFIPLAEQTGLIINIGEWVLEEACRQAKRWQESGHPVRVAVNISALQFRRGNLMEIVQAALARTRLAPALLELELTESVLLHHTDQALEMLGQLKEMGVTLSIDDFGTGYSSLSYLKRLSVDKLKIDQSFIRDMEAADENAAIVLAIIQLGRTLGLSVIAEGVETRAQCETLKTYGCDEVQGYLFGHPVPAREFERLFTEASEAAT